MQHIGSGILQSIREVTAASFFGNFQIPHKIYALLQTWFQTAMSLALLWIEGRMSNKRAKSTDKYVPYPIPEKLWWEKSTLWHNILLMSFIIFKCYLNDLKFCHYNLQYKISQCHTKILGVMPWIWFAQY